MLKHVFSTAAALSFIAAICAPGWADDATGSTKISGTITPACGIVTPGSAQDLGSLTGADGKLITTSTSFTLATSAWCNVSGNTVIVAPARLSNGSSQIAYTLVNASPLVVSDVATAAGSARFTGVGAFSATNITTTIKDLAAVGTLTGGSYTATIAFTITPGS